MADNVIQTIERPDATSDDWSSGAAYIDGAIMPLREAKIPVTDWGYRRSDVTYDVVGVYYGAFFRLEDHIRVPDSTAELSHFRVLGQVFRGQVTGTTPSERA